MNILKAKLSVEHNGEYVPLHPIEINLEKNYCIIDLSKENLNFLDMIADKINNMKLEYMGIDKYYTFNGIFGIRETIDRTAHDRIIIVNTPIEHIQS